MTQLITLQSKTGSKLSLMSTGAALTSLQIPVGNAMREVLLGCKPEDYARQSAYLNAIAGRFANRIAKSELHHNGETFKLVPSQGEHCLHGGIAGFDKKEWQIAELKEDTVTLTLCSEDGDQGFPGECQVTLTYTLEDNDLLINIQATVTKDSPVNLTSHAYFNLDGKRSDVRHHYLQMNASRYLPIDTLGIPFPDSPAALEGALDLREMRCLQEQWLGHPQLVSAKGFDHCYLLDTKSEQEVAATLVSSDKKLRMDVYTNQPGLQLYTGNYLAGNPTSDEEPYHDYEGLCLEAELLPDSPNRPELGDPWLKPGQTYHHVTRYAFKAL